MHSNQSFSRFLFTQFFQNLLVSAGADMLVTGSAAFGAADAGAFIRGLKALDHQTSVTI